MCESKYKIGDKFVRKSVSGFYDCFTIDSIIKTENYTIYYLAAYGYVDSEYLESLDKVVSEQTVSDLTVKLICGTIKKVCLS